MARRGAFGMKKRHSGLWFFFAFFDFTPDGSGTAPG